MWSVFFKSFSIMNKKLTPLLTLEREFLNTKNLPPPKIAIHMVHFLKKKKKDRKMQAGCNPRGGGVSCACSCQIYSRTDLKKGSSYLVTRSVFKHVNSIRFESN